MKFDHILVPIDFSERSRVLNEQVEWLAARFGSRVTLLHVFEIPASWYGACEASYINTECFTALSDSARQRLREYVIHVPEPRVERVLVEGNPAAEIMNWIDEHDVDLVMMGTHGYGALQGWILGSVTEKVLHSTTRPVWTASGSGARLNDDGIKNLLCALEITEEAVPLLQFTKQLSEQLDARVRLVHTVPELETRPNRYFDFDLHQYLMESARVEISKIQRQAGTEFPLSLSGTGISTALAEVANQYGADLLVIGRGKARKALGRFQTHAYEIIRHAPCPVLSYALSQPDHISSSCTVGRLAQSATDGQLLTGSPTP